MNLSEITDLTTSISETVDKILSSKKAQIGKARQLIEEIKGNSRKISLYSDGATEISELAGSLSTEVFDELNHEGFNFKSMGKRKIRVPGSLSRRDLASWDGKPFDRLLKNVYDKIKDFSYRYSASRDKERYLWDVRIVNIQMRIYILMRNFKDF